MQQQTKYNHGALTAPEYPNSLPTDCKWLGGEGYGVWFLLTKESKLRSHEFRIRRFTDDGSLDCDRVFRVIEGNNFDENIDFEFGYISHCQQCTVYQKNQKFVFEFITEFSKE